MVETGSRAVRQVLELDRPALAIQSDEPVDPGVQPRAAEILLAEGREEAVDPEIGEVRYAVRLDVAHPGAGDRGVDQPVALQAGGRQRRAREVALQRVWPGAARADQQRERCQPAQHADPDRPGLALSQCRALHHEGTPVARGPFEIRPRQRRSHDAGTMARSEGHRMH